MAAKEPHSNGPAVQRRQNDSRRDKASQASDKPGTPPQKQSVRATAQRRQLSLVSEPAFLGLHVKLREEQNTTNTLEMMALIPDFRLTKLTQYRHHATANPRNWKNFA